MLGHLPRSNTIQYNTIQCLTSFLVALATMQCPARLQYTISSFHQYKTEPNLQYFILKSRFVVFLEIIYKSSPSTIVFTMFANILQMKFKSVCKYWKYLGGSVSIRRCNLRAVSFVIVIVIGIVGL